MLFVYGQASDFYFCAARMGSVPIVTFLLDIGADVTIENRRGLTPLQVSLKTKF